MKWWITHLDRLDPTGARWVRDTVTADKCYIASSGVISFLEKPPAAKAEEDAKLLSVPSPEAAAGVLPASAGAMVPRRVVTDLPKNRKNRFAGKKGSTAFEPIRAFAHGEWSDLEKAK